MLKAPPIPLASSFRIVLEGCAASVLDAIEPLERAARRACRKASLTPVGEARVVREGADLTLIAYGAMMRPTLAAAEDLSDLHRSDTEVIALLSISPMDTATLIASVSKTGRCVIVHEGPRTCGIAAEIIARINEHAFEHLLAPIKRVTGYDIHFPRFQCEEHYLPDAETIIEAVKETLAYE